MYQIFKGKRYNVPNIERIVFQETGLDWIDELNLYIEYSSDDTNEEFMVLTNSGVYNYNEKTDTFSEYDVDFEIKSLGNIIPLFLFDGNKIRTASILLHYCPRLDHSVQHYAYAISHELSHIYNLLEMKKERQNDLVRDQEYLEIVG